MVLGWFHCCSMIVGYLGLHACNGANGVTECVVRSSFDGFHGCHAALVCTGFNVSDVSLGGVAMHCFIEPCSHAIPWMPWVVFSIVV